MSRILEIFNQYKPKKYCGKVYCSTCGGWVHPIRQNITPAEVAEIKKLVIDASNEDLMKLGELYQLIRELLGIEYGGSYTGKSIDELYKKIEFDDVRSVDSFLYRLKNTNYKGNDWYSDFLEKTVEIARKTNDRSLIETMIIVLGSEFLNYSEVMGS